MKHNMEKAWADFRTAQAKEWGDGRPMDLAGAAKLYRRAAMRGLAEAQHALGFLCSTGQGVARSEALAVAWFERAAAQGHCAAQHNLAVMYAEGRGTSRDYARAVYWFHRAARGGSEIARDWLAMTRQMLREQIAVEA
jgi:TPR repeat protein